MMPVIAVWACVFAGQAAAATPLPFERLARWTALAVSHAAGEHDDAASDAARLSAVDLGEIAGEITEAARLLERATRDGLSSSSIVRAGDGTVTLARLAEVLAVPEEDFRYMTSATSPERVARLRTAVGRLLERGALLHGDTAVLVPPLVRLVRDVEPGARATLRVQDGRAGGIERTADSHATVHFAFGSHLLGLQAGDVRDEAVRAWYRATSAFQLAHEMYGDVMPHLEEARQVIPGDPVILFYSGALHEVFALPRSQAVVQSIELPPGMAHDIGTEIEELQMASAFYERALERDPNFHLAALHHGRVLDQLGSHAAGRATLERARPALTDRPSQYFAELFLGDASRNLGEAERARAHYTRAAELYPRAQTPGLALSALARERGGREQAAEVIRTVLNRRVGRSLHDDPWWTYYQAHVADNGEMLASLRATLGSGTSR